MQPSFGITTKAAATTATQTAGLQLAIWELLYNGVASSYSDATFNSSSNKGFYITTTGNGQVTAAEDYATLVLNNFKNLTATGNVEWLNPTTSGGTLNTGSQGLLYQIPGTQTLTAPDVSSTLPLFGMAIMALGVASRKLSGSKA